MNNYRIIIKEDNSVELSGVFKTREILEKFIDILIAIKPILEVKNFITIDEIAKKVLNNEW